MGTGKSIKMRLVMTATTMTKMGVETRVSQLAAAIRLFASICSLEMRAMKPVTMVTKSMMISAIINARSTIAHRPYALLSIRVACRALSFQNVLEVSD